MRTGKTMRAMLIGLGMLVLVLVSAPVHAATPLDTVRTEVNKVLDALRNKGLKEEAKKETLRLVYKEMFDQVELAKWSLGGNNWNKFTETQRQEFVALFQQVLEKAYADKILAYTDEKITFDREVTITKNRVEVQTRVLTKSKEIPINYRVVQESDGTWKVYDVVVENVSLVMNYRSQFNDILSKNKPEQLLDTLRKKVKDQKA
jgi:phospholipid transport system substrate-binding protein